ncbi:MAG: hypothetical protein AAB536_02885 [Patescibacteria group bacterium]
MQTDSFTAAKNWLQGEIVFLTESGREEALNSFDKQVKDQPSRKPQDIAEEMVNESVYARLAD